MASNVRRFVYDPMSTRMLKPGLMVLIVVALMMPTSASLAQAQTVIKAPLRNAPVALETNKTHLVFSGVTSNFPRIAVWLFQGMYQTLPRGTFRGDVMFIGDGAVVGTKRICDGQAHF